jgi:hypothetical protein
MYTYLFIREDLPPAQQIIQASHATHALDKAENTNIVLFKVKDEEQLMMAYEQCIGNDIPAYMFYEPDV